MTVASLKSKNLNSWMIYYNLSDEGFLFNQDFELESKLIQYLKFSESEKSDFSVSIQIQSVYFLLGVFPSEYKMVIFSSRASREITWAQTLNKRDENHEIVLWLKRLQLIPMHSSPLPLDLITKLYSIPTFEEKIFDSVHVRSKELATKLIHYVNDYNLSLFEKLTDFGLDLTAKYDLFRVHILKFLAILPSLNSDPGREVKRVLDENLRRLLSDNHQFKLTKNTSQMLPSTYELALKIARFFVILIPWFILAPIVRSLVKMLAKRFIAGEDIEKSLITLEGLSLTSRDATLDQLGELVVSEKEALHYEEQVLKIIRGLRTQYKRGECNLSGINRAHVSIKVSALSSVFKPEAFDFTFGRVAPRLRRILLAAKEEAVFINVDAEHYHYRDLVFQIYRKVLLETKELHDYSQTGIVIQCYLRDAYLHLKDVIELGRLRNLTMPVRLVKGAYWDAETIEARAHSFVPPQFLNKEETDIHFRQIIYTVLQNYPQVQLAVASHNIDDHAFSEALRENMFPKTPAIEHQCLHMTYEALSTALAKIGWPTRNYMPIGNLLVGMAYLVRRIMENSSQVGILSQMRASKKIENLISPLVKLSEKRSEKKLAYDWILKTSGDFLNINPVRLYNDEERKLFNLSFNNFKKNNLGIHYETCFRTNGESIKITCPSNPELLVGSVNFATTNDLEQAFLVFKNSNKDAWTNDAAFRVNSLLKASDLILYSRFELAFLIVYEAGKSFSEALADVDEAIDFLNFYAREELKLQNNQSSDLQPIGIIGVIAPWNFPLAIPCGMVAGALVAGNQVILKSAEQTPLIATKLVNIFYQAGVPADILIHLPGPGETVGKALVDSTFVKSVIFTGSKQVGEMIYKTLTKSGRKAITEMGGKNAVIVTANAELDETVSGILFGAFSHAGQKCSAASRVIAHENIIDKLGERLKEALMDIKVGDSFDPSIFINPVINTEEKKRIQENVKAASNEAIKSNGIVLVDRSQEKFGGSIIGPTLIRLPYEAALMPDSFARRELFGPVLHLIPYKSLDQAIRLFNNTEYGLTGGIYGQSQDDIDYLLQHLLAGNLYVNRPNTGARVGIEPFGGFKMSGTGPKAGSAEYVKIFHQSVPSFNLKALGLKRSNNQLKIEFSAHSNLDSPLEIKDKMIHVVRLINFTNSQFLLWLNHEYEKLVTKGKLNTVIPGQISENHFECSKKRFAIITEYFGANERVLLTVMMALLARTQILIFSITDDGYEEWIKLVNFFHLAGFSKECLDVYKIDDSTKNGILDTPSIEVFYLDEKNSIHDCERLMTRSFKDNLPIIFDNDQNGFYLKDMNLLFEQFIMVRSFAINTMRHGAPLELEIQ